MYLCICKLIWKLVDNGLFVFLQVRIGARPNVNLNYKKNVWIFTFSIVLIIVSILNGFITIAILTTKCMLSQI